VSTAKDFFFLSLMWELFDEKEVLELEGANTFIILDVDVGIDDLNMSLSLLLCYVFYPSLDRCDNWVLKIADSIPDPSNHLIMGVPLLNICLKISTLCPYSECFVLLQHMCSSPTVHNAVIIIK
jgi:hypothetical protein